MGITASKNEYSLYQPLPQRFKLKSLAISSPFQQLVCTPSVSGDEVEFRGEGVQFV
ncbi:hypothetical protein BT69DRAFT_1285581, partial [Atractiella rhizophila]